MRRQGRRRAASRGMSAVEPGRTYRTLDGLRGVAALMVVTRHAGQVFPANLFPESFLAVDLFFLLSGFVIASAYEARLLAGQPLSAFMRTRLIRLYPLYALGLLLGLAAHVVTAVASGQPIRPAYLAEAAVVGAIMAPAVPPLPMGGSTLDGPTWTLLPELLVNLVYARVLRRLSTRAVWGVAALGAIGLVASERVYGTLDGGWWVASFPLVAARLAFSFFLGVGFFRLRPQRRQARWTAWSVLGGLALTLAIRPQAAWSGLYELAMVLGVFPLLTALAIRVEPGPRSGKVFAWLGVSSYAIYVLHQPLGVLAGVALAGWGLQASWPAAAAFVTLAALTATVADAVYDRPVRRWLSRRGAAPGGRARPAAGAAVAR
jgi:peptidoglycan/LPS O-acetylase OafA/YrhL